MAKFIKGILKKDMDCVVAITGGEGLGKSTCAMLIAMMMDKNFDFERNVIFMPTEKEVREKVFKLRKYTPIVLDEAMRVLYKREWQTRARRQLNILFSLCRKRNLSFFMCIPKLWDLDEYMREHRVRIWIYIPTRSYAMVFIKDRSPFAKDVWHRDKNQKIVEKAMKRTRGDTTTLINALSRLPNYAFSFRFPDMPKELKEEYLRLNMEHFKESELDVGEVEKEGVRLKRAKLNELIALGYLKYKLNMSYQQIAEELGNHITPNYIRTIMMKYRKMRGIKTNLQKKEELRKNIADRILENANE